MKWARNTDSFGQRMLRSQGWEPGQYLGAVDAPHAELHTAANASHIRVFMREDNLGIGAKKGRNDDVTGLDAFKDLLGRLNGKDEAVIEAERKAREDKRLNVYVQQKLGSMRFVAGGLLVGDQVRELVQSLERAEGNSVREDEVAMAKQAKISALEESADPEMPKTKRRRKGTPASETGRQTDQSGLSERQLRKKERRERRESKKRDKAAREVQEQTAPAPNTSSCEATQAAEEEKRARKKRRKAAKAAERVFESSIEPTREDNSARNSENIRSVPGSGTSTPSTQLPTRHISRQRFIAQKRMSVLDPHALNQV
jgi:Pin2-interacting protein X1